MFDSLHRNSYLYRWNASFVPAYVSPFSFHSTPPYSPLDPYQDVTYQEWMRQQVPPHAHGPERHEERHPHLVHVDWASRFPNEVILHGPPRREVAFTFDDGPDDIWTPRILDVLKQYDVKATFMCVGRRIQQHPQVLLRMIREGHIVGNHTWNHPNLTKITLAEARLQIIRTSDEINRIAGVRPRLFRPPYGALNADVIRELITLDYKIIFWNVDSLDWAKLTAPQVAANILAHTRPGSIILQHSAGGVGESLEDTVQAIPYVVETLRQGGYRIVTVPQMLNISAYH
ncbi:polysaccharide deacetylase family protein [Collibacillus ludicampi]|uniref:polysaccharide deacetylase family protein n=1 Tax=Collibacillus ludicampi TaxID=2771369 RepID=UPI00249471CE|nr:polysaccharide deacetylase family protein [Collibacillus ludicampi]